MIEVYRTTDKISLKIGDIVFKISPMTFKQRSEITAMASQKLAGDNVTNRADHLFLTLKYSIKEANGIKWADGSDFKLDMEPYDGATQVLTNESTEALLSSNVWGQLSLAASQLMAGIPREIVDMKGNKVKGIDIVYEKPKKKKTSK